MSYAQRPKLVNAINELAPGSHFWVGDTIDTLEWKCDLPQPSDVEIEAKHAELVAEFEQTEYQRLRAPEYPLIGDQLDALFHAGVFPPEMEGQIQAVKDKYPKPEDA